MSGLQVCNRTTVTLNKKCQVCTNSVTEHLNAKSNKNNLGSSDVIVFHARNALDTRRASLVFPEQLQARVTWHITTF